VLDLPPSRSFNPLSSPWKKFFCSLLPARAAFVQRPVAARSHLVSFDLLGACTYYDSCRACDLTGLIVALSRPDGRTVRRPGRTTLFPSQVIICVRGSQRLGLLAPLVFDHKRLSSIGVKKLFRLGAVFYAGYSFLAHGAVHSTRVPSFVVPRTVGRRVPNLRTLPSSLSTRTGKRIPQYSHFPKRSNLILLKVALSNRIL